MSEYPVDLSHVPPPPMHEEMMHGGFDTAPKDISWYHESAGEFARMMCCGCSVRFMPHGDVVIVPCKKHKKRMLAVGGHCDIKKP